MFTYDQLKIDSAIPLDEILNYFESIGVVSLPRSNTYLFCDLEIKLQCNEVSSSFNIIRHEIEIIRGERTAAENFLTNFRLRFLSAGG